MGKGRGRADKGSEDIKLGFWVDFIHFIKYLMKFQSKLHFLEKEICVCVGQNKHDGVRAGLFVTSVIKKLHNKVDYGNILSQNDSSFKRNADKKKLLAMNKRHVLSRS